MEKTNKQINLYASDANTKPRFAVRNLNGGIRLNVIMDSGTAHVELVEY